MIVLGNQFSTRTKNVCLRLWVSVFLLACSPAVAGDYSASSILLNAFDRNFKIERDLRPEDIRVEVDRKQAQIVSLSLDSKPRRIVLMVDTSGSMERFPEESGWGITLPTAGYAVDVIPMSASAALVTFSDKLRRESNGFENRRLVGTRVLNLAYRQPKGLTALFDSIDQALIEFKELDFGDAIYLVTDGGDNKSKISLPKLEQELLRRGIRVLVFLVNEHAAFSGPDEERGPAQMDGLAKSTGGDVVRISSADVAGSRRLELDKLTPRFISEIEGVYRVKLGMSQVGKAVRVKVSFIDRDRVKNTRKIAYSHQIVP